MAIIKDVTVKINNGTATLDAPVQFYEKDHDVELRFRLMDYKYKYDKDPQNILNSVDEDVLEAYTTIVNPRGYELEQINGVVKNDIVIFRLDPTYTDELDELGTYKLQIHIKCTHSEFTIPPITFEVLQRLKGIKVVTDGEDEVDNSEILDNSSKFVSDETGKLIIEWKKGDMISSAKLNAMVDVINDAVDEEKIRQENEIEREKKANNKIQELENTRVEYVNKFDDELDSFADQVDTTMSDYETRFNALTVSQQQDAEIIDARDGEQTLRARLDRDIQKPSIIYEDVEGSYINVDTTCGYAQNVEILGNTIQDQNDLADIRSVGDKVEGQELYEIPVLIRGKNLFNIADYDITDTNKTTFNYDATNNTYTLTYSGTHPCIVFDLTKHLYIFEGKEFISSCKFLNSNSSAKNSIYLEGIDSNGNKIYFNSNYGYKIPKNTLSELHLKILANNSSVSLSGVCTIENIQIELGTVATPYEPYQGNKLTILSPVQLEKVGDVADRIICKDGVWGVEKNIVTKQVHEFSKISKGVTDSETQLISYHIIDFNAKNTNSISDLITNAQNAITKYVNGTECVIRFDTSFDTVDKVRDWCKSNGIFVKYAYKTHQFIPLPYDQQIKLRTFANKTNILFGCEIEPTLKASVPKSIGASIYSHSEQIDNLSKELEKINNLEETVTSEIDNINSDLTNLTESIEGSYVSVDSKDGYLKDIEIIGNTIQDQNDLADIRSVGDKVEGQELYEIPVLSCGKNLFNFESFDIRVGNIDTNGNIQSNIPSVFITYKPIKLKRNTQYVLHGGAKLLSMIYVKSVDSTATHIGVASYNEKLYFNTGNSEYFYIQFNTSVASNATIDTIREACKFLQLEETQATEYEPYQEQQITILSPTPLEKVGDVADRIICKDGVWGVEKNINTIVFNGSESWRNNISSDTHNRFTMDFIYQGGDSNLICDKFPAKGDSTTEDTIFVYRGAIIVIGISKDIIVEYDVDKFKAWLQTNPTTVLYQSPQPTFIPLPHDQQIKLRTFANKTNIHFLTEIEPTLKASVPKSISATVSTHTEQIDNLGKELDRVKKLEESTVSTVTTESDFTTVENTSNGYFEDVKLEGRTLVNLYPKLDNKNYASLGVTLSNDTITINANGSWKNFMIKKNVMPLKTSTYYTFVIHIIDNTIEGDDPIIHFGDTLPNSDPTKFAGSYHFSLKNKKGIYAFKLKTKDSFDNAGLDTRDHLTDKATSGTIVFKYMILEGDHTQNPPEYFEGIKSVGQDVDEISVESVNENMFDMSKVLYDKSINSNNGDITNTVDWCVNTNFIRVQKGITLFINRGNSVSNAQDAKGYIYVYQYNKDGSFNKRIDVGINSNSFTSDIDGFIRITSKYNELVDFGIYRREGVNVLNQSDKKRILYYNDETQQWEKPILRQWDSIEKHSDGKYYYHKRSGEVVLNGSEDWKDRSEDYASDTQTRFSVSFNIKPCYSGEKNLICDKYEVLGALGLVSSVTDNGILQHTSGSHLYITVPKTTLSEFKTWLQANPTTVVYQLAEEKVYECINIDLITYENETNFIVNSGAITPKSTLKVMCNINNVVRELQQKVSNLENYIQHVMIDALNNALNE